MHIRDFLVGSKVHTMFLGSFVASMFLEKLCYQKALHVGHKCKGVPSASVWDTNCQYTMHWQCDQAGLNLGCFGISRTSRNSKIGHFALAQHFRLLFWGNEMHSWNLPQHVFTVSHECSREKAFSCCQSEVLTSEMLVHFTFDRIISSIIEKEGRLAMWRWLSFIYCSNL